MHTLRIYVNTEYPDLVEVYQKAIEKHNQNRYKETPDSGFDLYVPIEESFSYDTLGKTHMIDFHIKTEMRNPDANGSRGYYLYPRSSISKTPLMLSNHVGIVDAGYRGNVMGAFRCIYREEESSSDLNAFVVPKHTRLLQICLPSLEPFIVEMVENVSELSNTERGEGGFGSTGGTVFSTTNALKI